jgi:hypothetical protein
MMIIGGGSSGEEATADEDDAIGANGGKAGEDGCDGIATFE